MNKYKSLAAWQHAHRLCIESLITTNNNDHPRSRPVFSQLQRAAVSVEVNIVEGYALSTTAQFRRHLKIALGSAAEAQCLIDIARELAMLPTAEAEKLAKTADKTVGTLHGLIRSLTPTHSPQSPAPRSSQSLLLIARAL